MREGASVALVRRSIVLQSCEPVKRGHPLARDDYGMLILHVSTLHAAAMPSASRPEPLTHSISELAKEFALTTRTIRFYESEGLLSPRRVGNRRIYAERERVRIKLILRGKRLGLSLSEIRELLDLYGATRGERAQLVKFLQVLSARRAMLNQQREDIAIVLGEIDVLERQCRKRLRPGAGDRE
jgi:DNA-binding transcriptional MerR regulator